MHIVWADDTQEDVEIVSVDDEGFVYNPIPPDTTAPYWTTFEEVKSVTSNPTSIPDGCAP